MIADAVAALYGMMYSYMGASSSYISCYGIRLVLSKK